MYIIFPRDTLNSLKHNYFCFRFDFSILFHKCNDSYTKQTFTDIDIPSSVPRLFCACFGFIHNYFNRIAVVYIC